MSNPQPVSVTDDLMSGAEFLASLRDGRAVYLYGERVADVTTHRAFRNSAASVARLYHALRDPDAARGVDDGRSIRHSNTSFFYAELFGRRVVLRARCDRALGPFDLRLHGPHAGLQGVVHGHAGRESGVLRALRAERPRLVSTLCNQSAVLESRSHQPAGGPQSAGTRGCRRIPPRRAGNGCRRRRIGGEDARHRIRVDARHVCRAEQRGDIGGRQGRRLCTCLHCSDGHAWHAPAVPAVVRAKCP